ncbi:MAG TPA: UDP-3-O-acyl-N-acetylglucosamine deacetylase [Puia sp.]|nr:UDP-3-O-acyl-N-acetylglucosamine deacetylase [Puia sp.]
MRSGFNPDKQHSLASEVYLSGKGLHTGVPAEMRLVPQPPDFGFQFRRVDLPGKPIIKANADSVINTFRGTIIGNNGATVGMIEHVLAALVGMGVDNCLIEVNNHEIPIMDGSCEPFIELIERAGVVEQNVQKIWYELGSPLTYHDKVNNVKIEAFPDSEYRLHTVVDFKSSRLGVQTASLRHMREFKKEIAPCRTYCLVHELDMLHEQQLIQGDLVKNAILLVDKPISKEHMEKLVEKFDLPRFALAEGTYLDNLKLHFDNEIARHKLLDMIGDLSLIGYPLKARIVGNRPGHTGNIGFARMVRSYIRENKFQKRQFA